MVEGVGLAPFPAGSGLESVPVDGLVGTGVDPVGSEPPGCDFDALVLVLCLHVDSLSVWWIQGLM